MANVINPTKLGETLQSSWTKFVDKIQLMRVVLEQVRDGDYRISEENPPNSDSKVSISFHSSPGKPYNLEMWAEFTAPKDKGIVIGTHVFAIQSNGDVELKETYGTHFLPKQYQRNA